MLNNLVSILVQLVRNVLLVFIVSFSGPHLVDKCILVSPVCLLNIGSLLSSFSFLFTICNLFSDALDAEMSDEKADEEKAAQKGRQNK